MKQRTIIMTTIVGVTALGLSIAGAVGASQGGDDQELPITGDALTSATEAALAHTGEGTVTDTEVGDEESLYEVEVRLDSGKEVDVQLDENFEVVGTSQDIADEQGDD